MTTRLNKVTPVAALGALALGAVALGMLLARPQSIATAQTAAPLRQITIIGTGEVKAAPDTAQVQVGVQTQAPTAQEALSQNSQQMTALINRLKESGIAAEDMQTSSVSIWPRYDTNGTQITGYEASNSVMVKIREIARAGELLDRVVEVGANNVSGISFTIDDPSALEQNARDGAIANARQRAEAMAQTLGDSLGQVLSVTENIGQVPPPQPFYAPAAAEAAADRAVPIEPGQQTISAQVQITYELR